MKPVAADEMLRTRFSELASGRALKVVRDRRLYREKFDSFHDYCLSQFMLLPERCDELIALFERF